MEYLGMERRLHRGLFLMDDFNNLIEKSPELDPDDVFGESLVDDYEKYIQDLTDDALNVRNRDKQIMACCKLIAHAYLLRILHFTSGIQIAASATDRLSLAKKKALTAFENYPEEIEDPVGQFLADINEMGKLLGEGYKLIVFEELPIAFKMISLFYLPLARDPNADVA